MTEEECARVTVDEVLTQLTPVDEPQDDDDIMHSTPTQNKKRKPSATTAAEPIMDARTEAAAIRFWHYVNYISEMIDMAYDFSLVQVEYDEAKKTKDTAAMQTASQKQSALYVHYKQTMAHFQDVGLRDMVPGMGPVEAEDFLMSYASAFTRAICLTEASGHRELLAVIRQNQLRTNGLRSFRLMTDVALHIQNTSAADLMCDNAADELLSAMMEAREEMVREETLFFEDTTITEILLCVPSFTRM